MDNNLFNDLKEQLQKSNDALQKSERTIQKSVNTLNKSDEAISQIIGEINYRIKAFNNVKCYVQDEAEQIATEIVIEEMERLMEFIEYRVMNQLSHNKDTQEQTS